MEFFCLNPWAFILFIFFPLVVFISLKSLAGLSSFRHRAALGTRIFILLLLILALAEIQTIYKSDLLTVIFLLDHSKSVPMAARKKAWDLVNREINGMGPKDRVSLLVFGKDSSLEFVDRGAKQTFYEITSVVDEEQTNIAQSIKLALAALPEDGQRRIVLVSDGNETLEMALDEALNAKSNQVSIDVIPYDAFSKDEVMIDKLKSPAEVQENEPFDLTIIVISNHDTTGVLRVFMDGLIIAERSPVNLSKGKNTFTISIPPEVVKSGFHKFQALIEAYEDVLTTNNSADAFTHVRGRPRVLYIEKDLKSASFLRDALIEGSNEKDKIDLTVQGLEGIPTNILELQSYDALILSNVPAVCMSEKQMEMIEKSVKEGGLGFIMIGGEDSFGAGGYLKTPIERALPVDMDVTNKKVIPNGALVMIMHSCEFQEGNIWAKDIGKKAIEVLSSYDMVGVLFYGWNGGEQWLFPLQQASNKNQLYNELDRMQPGDMPSFDPTMRLAYNALSQAAAGVRHIIILSDGDPSRPSQALMDQIKSSKITVSAISIQPHGGVEPPLMRFIAEYTGGRPYFVMNPQRLPEIFIKEALEVKRSLIFEKTLQPQYAYHTEPLTGIGANEIPPIHGYVVTTAKPLAKVPLFCVPEKGQQDPLFAHILYGLGRSVAFTSDAKNRWGSDWVSWNKYNQFWSQTVRWAMRKIDTHTFNVTTFSEGGNGNIVVDAVHKGKLLKSLKIEATVVTPKFNTLKFDLDQKGAGRYSGTFKTEDVGVYLINVSYIDEDNQSHYFNTGLTVPFSPEYRYTSTNRGLLQQIAEITGGRELLYEKLKNADLDKDGYVTRAEWKEDEEEFKKLAGSDTSINLAKIARDQKIFLHDKPRGGRPQETWPLLLTLAILFFPLDVFFRRVLIDYAKLYEKLKVLIHLRKTASPVPSTPTMARLSNVKKSVQKSLQKKSWDIESLEKAGKKAEPDTQVGGKGPKDAPKPEKSAEPLKPTRETPKAGDDSYTGRLLKAKKKTWDKDKKE